MDDCMYDAALLEADCAAEDRFVFTFARVLCTRVPVGLRKAQARGLAQLLLDEVYGQQVLPSRLERSVVGDCLEGARLSRGLMAAVCGVLRGSRARDAPSFDGQAVAA